MGSTIIEKILARASGRPFCRPGDIAICRPDMVVQIDTTIALEGAWYRPKKIFDADRVAVVFDHSVPAPSIREASGQREGRRFAREFDLKHHADVGKHGIVHVVTAERGLVRPGELLVCADSHTCAAGAFNCAGRGIGMTDTLQALTKGLVWFPVCPTIRYEFHRQLSPFVGGKDVFFHIAQVYRGHSNLSIEFGLEKPSTLLLNDRRTIATMCAEISAEFAIFDYDSATEAFLSSRMDHTPTPVAADADADYEDVRTVDLSEIEPYIMLPHAIPGNGVRVGELDRTIRIDQAFIGSCANGQIEDFRIAAEILRGRQVAPGVRLIITPGSQAVYLQAVRENLIESLLEAGAVITNSTCGACFGGHMGVLAPGEVCITASTRNFKGRMGSNAAEIYMGSTATVAASAVTGIITDPRVL